MITEISSAPAFDNNKRVAIPLSEIRILIRYTEESLQTDPNNATLRLYLSFLKEWEMQPRNVERDQEKLRKVSVIECMIEGLTAGSAHCLIHELIVALIS